MNYLSSSAVIHLDGSVVPARELVGGKARSIAAMRAGGLAVPPAFVLTTSLCAGVAERGETALEEVWSEVRAGVAALEGVTGRTFGGGDQPLLVSVRSGAARSMPGMMDTVLNLGTTAASTAAFSRTAGPAFAQDVVTRFTDLWHRIVGDAVPEDPWEQLRGAVVAVFHSWQSPRAQAYRAHHGIRDEGGTAVTVQAMVYGNLDERSGTGVLFTRNPMTGAAAPFGEWLPGGQGEDVVSGRFTPRPLSDLQAVMPTAHDELLAIAAAWERGQGDVQDIEFTIEAGRLWVLQSRAAKRSPRAAMRIATALVDEGVLTAAQALDLVSPDQVRLALQPDIDPLARASAVVLGRGEPACPGIASGIGVVDPDEAEERSDGGKDVVLVRTETSPDDVHGMIAAVAVVTETGGATSHAAVVCRELGRPGVVGCGPGIVEALRDREITVDGRLGVIYDGRLPLVALSVHDPDLQRLATWAAAHGGHQELLAAFRPRT
jgi:pyruvate,orthophosphate dikinase